MARNYLLGRGERLTAAIPPVVAGRPRPRPYTPAQAAARLAPQLRSAIAQFDALPLPAAPRGEAVALLTMHPQYVSKSEFPRALLADAGLRAVGSRHGRVTPEAWTRVGEPTEVSTVELFVAGLRESFGSWQATLDAVAERGVAERPAGEEAFRIESARAPRPADRLKGFSDGDGDDAEPDAERLLEVVLHGGNDQGWILEAFNAYLATLELSADLGRALSAGGLTFVPVVAPGALVDAVSRFAFVTAARPMPGLRPVVSAGAALAGEALGSPLPDSDPVDAGLRVAVFDGGIRAAGALGRWTTAIDADGVGPALPELVNHGEWVTSALLFGPLRPGEPASRPYAAVDHYRVLDDDSVSNPLELTDALIRIRDVLATGKYQFANISIGPDQPVDDADVSPWTAVLDEVLSSGSTLVTLAAGNYYPPTDADDPLKIRLPGDAVNTLTVGAADALNGPWARAPYSARGPGRSPGVVKPDILAFGGAEPDRPFYVVDNDDASYSLGLDATSVASPAALRLAVGARTLLGDRLDPLALKALLVHTSEDHPDGVPGRGDHGWGRAAADVDQMLLCDDYEVRVVYQGTLRAGGFLRAIIPVPAEPLAGLVTISATLCYACQTDPQDAPAYTRGGMETFMRPHAERYGHALATNPSTKSFFNVAQLGAVGLPSRAHLWETTMRRTQRFQASSLHEPVFDMHHNARDAGAPATAADDLSYALVVSVSAPRMRDLYNGVVRRYRTQLEVLAPQAEIEVET